MVSDDGRSDSIVLLVGIGYNLRCRTELLRTDDYKVDVLQRVQVLVRHRTNDGRFAPAGRSVRVDGQDGLKGIVVPDICQRTAIERGRDTRDSCRRGYIPKLDVARGVAERITCVAAVAEMLHIRQPHLLSAHHKPAGCCYLHIVEVAAATCQAVTIRELEHLLTRTVCRQGEAVSRLVGYIVLIGRGFGIEVRNENLFRRTTVLVRAHLHRKGRVSRRCGCHAETDIQLATCYNVTEGEGQLQLRSHTVQLLAVELTSATGLARWVNQIDGVFLVQHISRIGICRECSLSQSIGRLNQTLLTGIVAQEIIAITAVGIAGVNEVFVLVSPAVHALRIEKDIVAFAEYAVRAFVHVERHRRQVVQFILLKVLTEHRTAVAVNAHIGGIESGCCELVVGHTIHA